MSTPEQIKVIKQKWESYEKREEMNVTQIRRRMAEAGFSAAEIKAIEAADYQGK